MYLKLEGWVSMKLVVVGKKWQEIINAKENKNWRKGQNKWVYELPGGIGPNGPGLARNSRSNTKSSSDPSIL